MNKAAKHRQILNGQFFDRLDLAIRLLCGGHLDMYEESLLIGDDIRDVILERGYRKAKRYVRWSAEKIILLLFVFIALAVVVICVAGLIFWLTFMK